METLYIFEFDPNSTNFRKAEVKSYQYVEFTNTIRFHNGDDGGVVSKSRATFDLAEAIEMFEARLARRKAHLEASIESLKELKKPS